MANFGGSTERIRVYQRYHEGNKDFLVSSDYREGYQFGYLPNRTGKGFSVFTVFNPEKVSAEKKSALIRCNKNGKHYADVVGFNEQRCQEGGVFEGSIGTIWGAQWGAAGRAAAKVLYRCRDRKTGAFYVAAACYTDETRELLGWQP